MYGSAAKDFEKILMQFGASGKISAPTVERGYSYPLPDLI
jgi:hypothetical protein